MSIVLYRGPSLINGSEIVVLATLDSKNRKTGPMIQTWILPVEGPLQAIKEGSDDSACGNCPRRRSLVSSDIARALWLAAGRTLEEILGDCYVRIDAAPHATWKKWIRDGAPAANWDHAIVQLQQEAHDHGLRLGAYGDPLAVPLHVWQDLIDAIRPTVVTGYTHQWRASYAANFRSLVMASCDNANDASEAHSQGWRFFAAVPTAAHAAGLPKSIQCLADAKGITCEQCGICNGARTDRDVQPVSVWIAEHGPLSSAKAKRVSALSVLQ